MVRSDDEATPVAKVLKTNGKKGNRGAYAPTGQRLNDIVQAAVELFATQGFRQTSTREIARAAGLSEAGMRHHFPNKDALLKAVLEHREAEDQAHHDAGAPGAGRVFALLDVVAKNASLSSIVELYVVLSAEATDPAHPAHEHFRSRYGWVNALMCEAYDALRAEGRLRSQASSPTLARQTIALLDGLQVQWLYDRSFDMVTEIRAFIEDIAPGLSPEPTHSVVSSSLAGG